MTASWQQAVVGAAALLLVRLPMARSRRRRVAAAAAYVGQAAVVLGLYALWVQLLDLVVRQHVGAFSHARLLWRVERDLHLPSEVSLQRTALHLPLLVKGANLYYATVHYTAMITFLVWVFWRHRDAWPRTRLTLVLMTATASLLQAIPVAPPRMLPDLGFVDTGVLFHQGVYAPGGAADPGQVSCFPSMHVAWALFVGVTVVRVGRSRWRWLALLHTTATVLVVVVTGNHWWGDGIGAAAVLGLVLAGQRAAAAASARVLTRPLAVVSAVVPGQVRGTAHVPPREDLPCLLSPTDRRP